MGDVFYAMCFKEADQVNLRKFTMNWRSGPFFSVPTELWSKESHPLLQTDMEKIHEDLDNGQRRSIRIKIRDKDGNRTRLCKTYMNESGQFIIAGEPLKIEGLVNQPAKLNKHEEAAGKNLSAIELMNVFESMDSDKEEEDDIDSYLSSAKANKNNSQNKKRPLLHQANDVLTGSKKLDTKEDEKDKACMSIYSDLNELKKIFGRFELFKQCPIQGKFANNGTEWIELVESYLVKKYGKADGIITQFFGFIDKRMFDWYFALNFDTINSFSDFKALFLTETHRLHYEERSLVHLKKDDFLDKLKDKSDSDKLKKLIEQYPLTTYFVEKRKLVGLVYPNSFSDGEELTEFVLSQIGSQQDYEKFLRFKSDLETLLYYLKHQDMSKKRG